MSSSTVQKTSFNGIIVLFTVGFIYVHMNVVSNMNRSFLISPQLIILYARFTEAVWDALPRVVGRIGGPDLWRRLDVEPAIWCHHVTGFLCSILLSLNVGRTDSWLQPSTFLLVCSEYERHSQWNEVIDGQTSNQWRRSRAGSVNPAFVRRKI